MAPDAQSLQLVGWVIGLFTLLGLAVKAFLDSAKIRNRSAEMFQFRDQISELQTRVAVLDSTITHLQASLAKFEVVGTQLSEALRGFREITAELRLLRSENRGGSHNAS